MRLEPQKRFPITRALDPHDTDTNYVRALVYHLKLDNTETLLATVDLTNTSGQRFLKYWRIKAQTAEEGDWVRIETIVYTDLGYTTKNENYGDEANLHIIKAEVRNRGFGGGTGGGIDYKKLKRIIENILKKNKVKASKVVVKPTSVTVKLKPVTEVLNKIVTAIENTNELSKDQKEELNKLTTQVEKDFGETKQAIDDLPEPPSLDPVTEALQGDTTKIAEALKVLENYNKSVADVRAINSRIDLLLQIFTNAKKNFEFVKVAALQIELQKRDKDLAEQLAPIFKIAEELEFLHGKDKE